MVSKRERASKLFDVVSKNAQKQNCDLPFSKNLFLHTCDEDYFDPLLYLELENKEYLEVVYLKLLKRAPEKNAFDNWVDKFSLPKEEFQKLAFITLFNSAECKSKGSIVKNNIFNC